jgi:two-component system, cell cycle sensor histidine kinase and response regulator CckA
MNGAVPKPRFTAWLRALILPLILLVIALGPLVFTFWSQMRGPEQYDQAALREWFEEGRVFRSTLAQLVNEYRKSPPDEARIQAIVVNKHLSSLGEMTRKYPGQLPLFPILYRLEVELPQPGADTLAWDSNLPRGRKSLPMLEVALKDGNESVGTLKVWYQLHAYNKQEQAAQEMQTLGRWLSAAAALIVVLAIGSGYFLLRRERRRELQQLLAQHQVEHAEKLLLENELRRQEAEHLREEAERKFLEQRVATHEAEQKALEVKSQLYASIGIMAGSYAHNIKNLLVRPNDLIRRCMETNGLRSDQKHMLGEVGDTLHTVTERLQQILKTVRRDPTRSELAPIDLNDVAQEIGRAWQDMARDKWKLTLTVETFPQPLVIEADHSHLMQAVENLLFNARDATYEMRHRVREEARGLKVADSLRESASTRGASGPQSGEAERKREALIAAAAWKGAVTVRTGLNGGQAVLEITDNGIGMTPEVRQRCVETHFSTKRNNALFEGDTTGMGLGLSFVQTILETHGGRMEIESEPMRGTTFRLAFPLRASSPLAPSGERGRG